MNNRRSGPSWPNLTPSRAGDLVCRKKFYELHVLKNNPGETFSRALVFGSATHDLFKRVYNPVSNIPPQSAAIEALAQRVFQSYAYPDPAEREEDRERCARMVRAYVMQDAANLQTVGVEIFADVGLTNSAGETMLTLGAKFDQLLVRPEAPTCLVVRDYKTGKPGPASLDAACIMLAVARKKYTAYETCVMEFDWVGLSGLVQRTTITLAQVKEVWKELRSSAMRVYHASELPAEPGEHCLFCPLKPGCQPDVRATDEEIEALFM